MRKFRIPSMTWIFLISLLLFSSKLSAAATAQLAKKKKLDKKEKKEKSLLDTLSTPVLAKEKHHVKKQKKQRKADPGNYIFLLGHNFRSFCSFRYYLIVVFDQNLHQKKKLKTRTRNIPKKAVRNVKLQQAERTISKKTHWFVKNLRRSTAAKKLVSSFMQNICLVYAEILRFCFVCNLRNSSLFLFIINQNFQKPLSLKKRRKKIKIDRRM